MKRTLILALALALSCVMAVTGTIAYLSDTDEDVNVMTLGNVDIEQLEFERVVENGAWVSTGETDKYGYTPDKVKEFTQDKPLYPAYFADGVIKWDDRNGSQNASGDGSHQQSWGGVKGTKTTGAPGSIQLFDDSVKGAIDKFVFVENTGTSDAYVRTWFAFEQGSLPASRYGEVIRFNTNDINGETGFGHWKWEQVATDVTIAGPDGADNKYVVCVATYLGASSVQGTEKEGILAPGTISYPSLLQVYMRPEATNDDVTALDGNKSGKYDILVYSQAVQTTNFENAEQALNAAFGEPVPASQPFTGIIDRDEAEKEHLKNNPVEFSGVRYATLEDALEVAEQAGGGTIILHADQKLNETTAIPANMNITIDGNGYTISRADGFTGTVLSASSGSTLTLIDTVVDGGAVWTGAIDSTLNRGTTNSGIKATGNLIVGENNSAIVLKSGAILQNNEGAHAVNLGTRIGCTLTIDGGQIINNASDSGAIWGGGNITLNSGKISNNSSTGAAGAIRMVSSCNLTINGGEINNNVAASDGGAIWGYGASNYTFTGGEMSGNKATGTGGAIYTGTYSVINISGNFELCNNTADNSGAIRLTDHASLNMTGGTVSGNKQNGESNAFNTWNNAISLTGGTIADDISYVGGLALTIGEANISGVISYDLATNHNTAYLAKDFNGFSFKVNETSSNFSQFNFKPADGYTYSAGDEAKLVCLNDGYTTVWHAASGTFRLQAK